MSWRDLSRSLGLRSGRSGCCDELARRLDDVMVDRESRREDRSPVRRVEGVRDAMVRSLWLAANGEVFNCVVVGG